MRVTMTDFYDLNMTERMGAAAHYRSAHAG
jgi:hypothetical protein